MLAELIVLGTMTVTSYQATPAQTKPECQDNWHCHTSIGDVLTPIGCAVSQDLLKSGRVQYHEWLYVEGYGYCYVNDTMHHRHINSVDLFAWQPADESRLKPRRASVYKLNRQPRGTNGRQRVSIGKEIDARRPRTSIPGFHEGDARATASFVY